MDGSTDCSVTEKELIYAMYVNSDKPECRFCASKTWLMTLLLELKLHLKWPLLTYESQTIESKWFVCVSMVLQ